MGKSGILSEHLLSDDAKKLYSGFDLCAPKQVSMTINGPAPMMLGFFLNAAIDQHCEKHIKANGLEREVEKVLKAKWDQEDWNAPGIKATCQKEMMALGSCCWDAQVTRCLMNPPIND